jgi:hypothetical protein
MVIIKGREIAIEQSAIPRKVRSNDRFAALSPRPGLFMLRPDWTKRLFGGMCAVGGAILVAPSHVMHRDSRSGNIDLNYERNPLRTQVTPSNGT